MKIMVVEDDENLRHALETVLVSKGHETFCAHDAHSAISLIDERVPDLTITDWDLGGQLNGVDVANYLTRVSSDSYLIFITAKSIKSLRESTSHLNVFAYVQKPFTLDDIRLLIDAALSN